MHDGPEATSLRLRVVNHWACNRYEGEFFCPKPFSSVRTPDLIGILGDTFFLFSEGIAESKLGAREGAFGGVEVVEQVLDCSVRTGIG